MFYHQFDVHEVCCSMKYSALVLVHLVVALKLLFLQSNELIKTLETPDTFHLSVDEFYSYDLKV
jgi:hypothetical protein